ncbi:MAG: hypothetical protein LAT57_11865 [Balneolales bacterium]|nr:hypothetical protein [Balneolales bacterium]
MSTHHPKDILERLSAFVDGEVSSQEHHELQSLVQNDTKAKRFTDDERELKRCLKRACSKTKASAELRNKCLEAINSQNITSISDKSSPLSSKGKSYYRLMAAASVLLAVSLAFWFANNQFTSAPSEIYAVESYVYQHFMTNHDIELMPYDTKMAQSYIYSTYQIDMTVPELDGATFKGMSYAEFVPGFNTPVLVYHVADTPDPVMIFAFEVEAMHGDIILERDEYAVATCTGHDDVHIKDIDGKHIVSWKWNGTWYSGISHHDGEVLASMLPINR